jgi:threonine dehydrogenase-like Zn-dependent dehydrogenase
MQKAGVDRLAALLAGIETVRMGQANVKRWVDDIMPLLTDADPLGVDELATHHLPLDQAPDAYATFQKKEDGVVKVVFTP